MQSGMMQDLRNEVSERPMQITDEEANQTRHLKGTLRVVCCFSLSVFLVAIPTHHHTMLAPTPGTMLGHVFVRPSTSPLHFASQGGRQSKREKEVERYEEEYFVRLNVSKKDRKKSNPRSALHDIADFSGFRGACLPVCVFVFECWRCTRSRPTRCGTGNRLQRCSKGHGDGGEAAICQRPNGDGTGLLQCTSKAHTDTDTQTHTDTHRHTQTHTDTHTDTHTHRHTDTHTHTHTHTCIRLRLPLFGGFRQKRRSEGGENKRCSNSSQRSCFHMPFEHCVLVAGAPSERENRNQLRCGGGEQRPPPPPPQHNMKTSPFQEEEKATNSHCSC